ncbi:hypothetical protein ACI48D_07260 [Massilia sp. LXY-6]|uniref:hypothetical protein n=1 Tax=Massilia sp. LXY-6 TaxID=3379823 RepID=UPI003EE23E95
MKKGNAALDSSIRNTSFAAFLFITLGFLLLEACTFRFGGKPVAHITNALIGISISALIWRRVIPYWAVATKNTSVSVRAKNGSLPRAADVASGILLAGMGYLGADALLSEWVTPVWAFTSCLYLFPWSGIPLCRSGLLVPCSMIALGAAAHLCWAAHLPHPISFLLAVWVLWTMAACCWLRLIFLRQKKLKTAQPAPQDPADLPEGMLHN